ncbi:hypothetical protein SANTM175S_03825 [Streptomyces antimycoticus]
MGSGFMDAAAAMDPATATAAEPEGGFGAGTVREGLGPIPEGAGVVCEGRKEAVEIVAPAPGRAPVRLPTNWIQRGAAVLPRRGVSDLLAGQFDEDMVTSLAGQLLIYRLADWCAIWLDSTSGPPRLARVWHASEGRIEGLRRVLEKEPPQVPAAVRGSTVEWPWPADPAAYGPGGAAMACRLVAGGRALAACCSGGPGWCGCRTKRSVWSRTSPAASPWHSPPPAVTPGRRPSAGCCSAACYKSSGAAPTGGAPAPARTAMWAACGGGT